MSAATVDYADGPVHLRGAYVRASGSPSQGCAVMLVHGGAGLDSHAVTNAERLAAVGFDVFACDMYGVDAKGHRERIMSALNALRQDRLLLRRRAEAGLGALRQQAGRISPIAVVGYCFGGLVALELARAGVDLAATVSVHGSLSTVAPAAPGSIRARVLVCHGALDPFSPPETLTAFTSEMNGAAADWRLIVYGGAVHGFTHETATGTTPGVRYDAAADAQSFKDVTAFLGDTCSRLTAATS